MNARHITAALSALAGILALTIPPARVHAAVIQINEETTATYVETDSSFTLILTGTRLDDDRNSPVALGTDWNINLVLTLDNNGDGDSVLLNGSIFHVRHPAPEPPGGPSTPVNIASSIIASNDPPLSLNFTQRTLPHAEHWDKYTQQGTWARVGNQLESWSISITGSHALTPAPASLALIGLGGLIGAARRRA